MTSHGSQASTEQRRPYQGYPYVNNIVSDIPSVDRNDPRWMHLSKQASTNTIHTRQPLRINRRNKTNHKDKEEIPVVYVEIPENSINRDNRSRVLEENSAVNSLDPSNRVEEDSSQSVNDDVFNIPEHTGGRWINVPNRVEAIKIQSPPPSKRKQDENIPVVYVDIPGNPSNDSTNGREIDSRAPDIYIDLPETSGRPTETESAPSYVDDTIFFDQFENRRINVPKADGDSSSDESISDTPKPVRRAPAPPRPPPPNTLPLQLSPTNLNKDAYVQSRLPTPDDGFSLTPLPITEFPEPPPAYSEIDVESQAPRRLTQQSTQNQEGLPRTRVITRNSILPPPTIIPTKRKLLTCQHCGTRVHTMVLKQAGAATHFIALSFLFFCLFPITLLIYCTNCFKYENHYCPICSKLIGYEVPVLCQKLVLVGSESS